MSSPNNENAASAPAVGVQRPCSVYLVTENRARFLAALRSGEYPKGPFIKGEDRPPEGAQGFCAVGLPYTLFCGNRGSITVGLRRELGLMPADLYRIQNEWNDTDLTFPEIADLIEREIFSPQNV